MDEKSNQEVPSSSGSVKKGFKYYANCESDMLYRTDGALIEFLVNTSWRESQCALDTILNIGQCLPVTKREARRLFKRAKIL